MRLLLSLCLAGCLQQQQQLPPPDPPTPDNGWTTPTGPVEPCGGSCGTEVCARDGGCYPASDIRAVHASWTIAGGPANSQSCTADLFIQFTDNAAFTLGFAPVPCTAGRFTVDKLPREYTSVFLSIDGNDVGASAPIDADGNALLDL